MGYNETAKHDEIPSRPLTALRNIWTPPKSFPACVQVVAELRGLTSLALAQRSPGKGIGRALLEHDMRAVYTLERLRFGGELGVATMRSLLLANKAKLVELDFGPAEVLEEVSQCSRLARVAVQATRQLDRLREVATLRVLEARTESGAALRTVGWIAKKARISHLIFFFSSGFFPCGMVWKPFQISWKAFYFTQR